MQYLWYKNSGNMIRMFVRVIFVSKMIIQSVLNEIDLEVNIYFDLGSGD